VVPVERKVISRLNFDSVVGLNITHDVASHVNGVEILDRRIVVAALAILAIVRRNSDALERALIYTVDEDTLKELVMRPDKLSSE
jgi:hypothetical protein